MSNRYRYKGGHAVDIPEHNLVVEPGAEVEVAGEIDHPDFEPVGNRAKEAGASAPKARRKPRQKVSARRPQPPPTPTPEPDQPPPDDSAGDPTDHEEAE